MLQKVAENVSSKERLCHANIPSRKAALVRNYFSRRNNFALHTGAVNNWERVAGQRNFFDLSAEKYE